LIAKLKGNEVDIAFLRPPLVDSHDWLGLDLLFEEELVAVLPVTHPLAGNSAVRLADLADENFILFPRVDSPGFFDQIVSACQRAGFSMKLGQETPNIPAIVLMVGTGFGVSIVPQSISQLHVDGVVYVPIEGEMLGAAIALGYRKDGQSQAVRNFVAVAKRHR
jgi:DNA-binding transcriptional LysR family regulator